MQGDNPHTSCVGSLSLVRQGSIPKAHFFSSVKQGLKYCMQEIASLGACVTRKFSLCIKIESCHVPATQTRMHLLLKQAVSVLPLAQLLLPLLNSFLSLLYPAVPCDWLLGR